MDPVNNASLQLTEYLIPWIALLASLVVTMWIKDWVTSFVKGMQFRRNKAFNEGDHVILDGMPAVVVKIGMTEMVGFPSASVSRMVPAMLRVCHLSASRESQFHF